VSRRAIEAGNREDHGAIWFKTEFAAHGAGDGVAGEGGERDLRHDAERRAGRQAHARPLATALKQWFEAKLDHLAQKSDTAKALRYALRHWDGLTLYLDDGRIEMDTNAVERAMRPIKLNAKNSLFAGCDEGAENWAVLASLIETCKLNGVSAEHWLADVLAKLVNGWPAARLDELLPWASTYTMHAQDPRLAA